MLVTIVENKPLNSRVFINNLYDNRPKQGSMFGQWSHGNSGNSITSWLLQSDTRIYNNMWFINFSE